MSVKLKKVPVTSCYLTSPPDGGGLSFALLADEEDDDEEDEEEQAAEDSDDDEEEEPEDMAEGDEDSEDDEESDEEAAEDDESEEDEEESKPETASRSFQMLAHTGKLISRWWGNLVLDMDGARFRKKLPLLKDHRTDQPLGFSTSIERTRRGLEARGRMLSNEQAAEVIRYSREGYPWQASLMAVPTKVEQVDAGAKATVNGREVLGPVTIFREWNMHELTITTLGADDDTETEAFAADGEIEVQITMTKKKTPTRAAPEVNTPPADPAVTPTDAAQLERERVSTILESADPAQMQLAQQLVKDGVPLAEALSKLNVDLRERLSAAHQGLRVHAQPIASGNHAGSDGAGGTARLALDDMPQDVEALAQQWDANPALRSEFDSKGAFLAWGENRHRAVHAGNGDEGLRQILRGSGGEKLSGGLKGLGHRNVQGNYFMRYGEEMARLWYPRIVTSFTTDQDHEIFKWLGNVANPRKWTGERQRTSLTDYGITLIGDKFELTVEADVDDVRRDKTGQILRRIGEMGRKMASLPQRLISTLLSDNPTAYDGLPMFSNAHVVGKSGTQSNDITHSGVTAPDAPTSEEMAQAILAGIQNMIGLLDDQGDPINEGARQFLIVGPTKYMNAAAAALKNEYTSAGVSNTIQASDFQISWATNPRLSGAASAAGRRFYIFREDAELRSILWQEENIPDAFKSQDANSGSGFWQDKLAWGSKRIVTTAPGRFELAQRVTLAV